jgi:hypothetical protein
MDGFKKWHQPSRAVCTPISATKSARNGHGLMSDLSPLSGVERKSNFGAVTSVDDPKADIPCDRSIAVLVSSAPHLFFE